MPDLNLPLWQSHKKVHAAPIAALAGDDLMLRITKDEIRQVKAAQGMFARYTPVPGDYYVVYDQGTATEYASISPKAAFEAGYDRVFGAEP